jgi:hypothetical protein
MHHKDQLHHKDYLHHKAVKKKSTLKYVWILVAIAIAIAFVVVVAKYALAGTDDSLFSQLPSSDEVYSISKEFVRPTIKSDDPEFSDSEYQFGQKQDSVYVIKSFVEAKDQTGQSQKTTFEITLKYKGGSKTDQNNWAVLNLNENCE